MNQNIVYILSFSGIILATFFVAFLFRRAFNKFIKTSTNFLQNDPTNYKFLKHFVVGLIYTLGFCLAVYSVPNLRTLAGSLLAGAGIAAVAISLASQAALSNIVGGVFIIIFKPFRINDRLIINTHQGIVEDITLRHTVIRDFENRRIVIPNSIISEEVIINADFTDERICKWIDMNITYDSDIDLAKSIMAEEVLNHPLTIDARTEEMIAEGAPVVIVRVLMLGESSVNLRAWAWAENARNAFILSCDALESIKKRFDREGVQIAFPHRVLITKDNQEKFLDKKQK